MTYIYNQYGERLIEATFERHNSSREVASTLRYMEKEGMFRSMHRCRMEGKHHVIAVFEHEDDIRAFAERLATVFKLGCLVSWGDDE